MIIPRTQKRVCLSAAFLCLFVLFLGFFRMGKKVKKEGEPPPKDAVSL